jgi:hypothetical protein
MALVYIRSVKSKRYLADAGESHLRWTENSAERSTFAVSRSGLALVTKKGHHKLHAAGSVVEGQPTMVQVSCGGSGAPVTLKDAGAKRYVMQCGEAQGVEYADSEAMLLQSPAGDNVCAVQFERSQEPRETKQELTVDEHERVMQNIASWLAHTGQHQRLTAMLKVYLDEVIEAPQLERLQSIAQTSSFDVQWNTRTLLFTLKTVDSAQLALQLCLRLPIMDSTKFDADALSEHLRCSVANVTSVVQRQLPYTRAGPVTDKLFVVHAETLPKVQPKRELLHLWAHAARSFITSGDIVVPGDEPWCADFVSVLRERSGGQLCNRVVVAIPAASSLDRTATTLLRQLADGGNEDVQLTRTSLPQHASWLRRNSVGQAVFILPCNALTFVGDGGRMNKTVEAQFAANHPELLLHSPWVSNAQLVPNNWKVVSDVR